MLDKKPRNRVTFIMNTNLSPVSGFRWNGCHYTLDDFTGKIQVRSGSSNVNSESIEACKCD